MNKSQYDTTTDTKTNIHTDTYTSTQCLHTEEYHNAEQSQQTDQLHMVNTGVHTGNIGIHGVHGVHGVRQLACRVEYSPDIGRMVTHNGINNSIYCNASRRNGSPLRPSDTPADRQQQVLNENVNVNGHQDNMDSTQRKARTDVGQSKTMTIGRYPRQAISPLNQSMMGMDLRGGSQGTRSPHSVSPDTRTRHDGSGSRHDPGSMPSEIRGQQVKTSGNYTSTTLPRNIARKQPNGLEVGNHC